MKKAALFLLPVLTLTGCTTVVKYEPKAEPGPAIPEDYPVYVYAEDVKAPRLFEIIGTVRVRDTPFTMFGGSLDAELKKVERIARREGADAVQLTSVLQPNFLHAKYRVDADLIRFTDVWESVSLTEEELLAYFRDNEETLDPVEGVWCGNDATQSRICIMKNNAMPKRDFIAFILDSMNPTWQPGDKKMDLNKGEWPWVYRGNYFHDDYQKDRIVFTLGNPQTGAFVVYLSEESAPVVFSRE